MVCWLNQLSSAREKVVVAAIASSRAGSAAIKLNRPTMRACSRAPGDLLLPRPPQPYRVHGDDRNHGDDQQQVDEQDDVDDLFARCDRRQVGQDQKSRERPHHRQADDHEANPEGAAAGAWQRRRTGIEQRIERRLGLRHHSAHALAGLPQCRRGAADRPARGRKQLAPSPEHSFKRLVVCSPIAVLLQQSDHTDPRALWHFRDNVGLAICRASVKSSPKPVRGSSRSTAEYALGSRMGHLSATKLWNPG